MTRARRALGAHGEALARRHLESLGYEIVEQNVRLPGGELDIVARDGSTLVFVEVRSRRTGSFGTPTESVDWRKRRRLAALAERYLHSRRLGEVPCRFDVVGITWSAGEDSPRVDHVPGAFSLGDA